MKVILILLAIIGVCVIVIIAIAKENSKLRKENVELTEQFYKLKDYVEKTDDKINELHTGDTVANALDKLSKH